MSCWWQLAGSGEELRPSAILVHVQTQQLFLREIISSLVWPQASASCRDFCFCGSRLGNSDKPSCPRQLENVDLKRNLLKGLREQTEEWKVAWPRIGGKRSREVSLYQRSLTSFDLWLRIGRHCWPSCGTTAALNSGHREEMQPSEPGVGLVSEGLSPWGESEQGYPGLHSPSLLQVHLLPAMSPGTRGNVSTSHFENAVSST